NDWEKGFAHLSRKTVGHPRGGTNCMLSMLSILGAVCLFQFKPLAQVYVQPKVLVINYDPVVKSESGKRLHEVGKWNVPHYLAEGYVGDLKECSGGSIRYRIVQWIDADEYPLKKDGFAYTEQEYLKCMRGTSKWHQPDSVDYHAIVRKYRLAERA